MKLTPPNLIHFSDKKLDDLNTPFSHNLSLYPMMKTFLGGHMMSLVWGKIHKNYFLLMEYHINSSITF